MEPPTESDKFGTIDELPELPKGTVPAKPHASSGGRRRSSFNNGRRISRIPASIRRESMGTQRLIKDFMSAAGVDHNQDTISSISSKKLDIIAPNFVPHHIRRFCEKAALEGDMSEKLVPMCEETFAAVVMVDVSGYSKLSAALAEKGPIGSELLSKCMKGYLDKIIETILKHGGDIVKFAGDAVIFYWKVDKVAEEEAKEVARGEIVLKAAQCCLDLLTRLGTYDINVEDCATKLLRIHLGIGAGPIYEVHVGGPPGRWEFFISGDGVNQLGSVLDLAKAGELAMSHQALKHFCVIVDIDTVTIGNYDKRCIILTGLEKARRKLPQTKFIERKPVPLDSQQMVRYQGMLRTFIDQTALFKVQADIKQSQLFGLEIELLDLLNLIELRQVTTVFIRIGDLQVAKGTAILDESQKAIQVVQTALNNYEGALRQLHVDDKGAVMLCFFGLPPMAHENDAGLGIKAAIEIKTAFLDLFDEFSLGITTGIVAFGGVGYNGRTEYAVMGDSINMAARLMCHPEAAENMLCDEKTYNLCINEFQFTNLGETKVKGKPHPISIFRPTSILKESLKKDDFKKTDFTTTTIGRAKERAAIVNMVGKLINRDTAGILVFEADGGQGLSTLYDLTRAEATIRGCILVCGVGSEIEKQTPYYCFRAILNDLFSLIEEAQVLQDGTLKILIKTVSTAKATSEQAPWMEPENLSNSSEKEKEQASTASEKSPSKMSSNFFTRGFSESFKKKVSADNPDKFQIVAIPSTIAEAPAHAAVRRKTSSEEDLDGDARVNHAELLRKQQDELNSEFCRRAKAALEKIGGLDQQASVLNLVMPSVFGDQDFTSIMSRRIRIKELSELIRRLIVAVTHKNHLVMCIKEAQYFDSLSWELLWEIVEKCPKMSIFIGTRRLANYDNEGNKAVLSKLKALPQAASMILEGLNEEETKQMIISCWAGPKIKNVCPEIVTDIRKRSDGKPLFIRSLIVSLKESGSFRILEDGTLSTQGKVDLGLSFDDRNIVIAQFDRLDRTFQLFLKIAAVIGQEFKLEDVLFFLTGMPGIFEKIKTNNLDKLVSGVEEMDRYGFLQKKDGQAAFFFKSTVVRQFIYSLMVVQQRQQLHARVAKYYESQMGRSNRYQMMIPIYEHYMESGDDQLQKKIHYLEAVAQYHFENESIVDAIKDYKTLFVISEHETIETNIIAGWHRELGTAYYYSEEYDKAETHLLQSLQLQEYAIPPMGIKFEWELKKQIATRQRFEKNLGPGPIKEDYVTSYPDYRGSQNLLAQESVESLDIDTFRQRRSPKINALLTFLALADLYIKIGQPKPHRLLLMMGLNLCEEMPKDSIYCRFMALNALCTHTFDDNPALAVKYLEVAETFDIRNNIGDSIEIVKCSAKFSFIYGAWAECKRKYDSLLHLGNVASDLSAIREALLSKAILFFFGNSRPSSIALSRELYSVSSDEDDWTGQFWGSYLVISNLMSLPTGETMIELQTMVQKHNALWERAPTHIKTSPVYLICRQGLTAALATHGGLKVNPTVHLSNFAELFETLGPDHWIVFLGCIHVYLAFCAAHIKDALMVDTNSKNVVNKICDSVHKITKSGLHPCILAADIKHLFKALKALVSKKFGEAEKAWITGAETQGQTDAVYMHGLFNASLAKFHEKRVDSEHHLAVAKTLLTKVGAHFELSKIWNL